MAAAALGVTFRDQILSAQTSDSNAKTAPNHPPADKSRVAVLGYHRFENPPRDPLAISSEEFTAQLREIKERGLPVITLDDFLAWRKGEKTLPPSSVLITIDDGYDSCYNVAWPILKSFGFPCVMFVYNNYISVGGKSITWEELREMRDGGSSVQSHSVSHAPLSKRKGRSEEEYQAWLWNELKASRDLIETHVGKPVHSIAYPYGDFDAGVQERGVAAGYALQFTVVGKKIDQSSPDNELGRYIIQSGHPEIFRSAIDFSGGGTPVEMLNIAVTPASGALVGEPSPLVSADLSALGDVTPASVELWLSGYGKLPAAYDAATKRIEFRLRDRLRASSYTATVRAVVGGKKIRSSWDFVVDRKALFEAFLPGSAGQLKAGG